MQARRKMKQVVNLGLRDCQDSFVGGFIVAHKETADHIIDVASLLQIDSGSCCCFVIQAPASTLPRQGYLEPCSRLQNQFLIAAVNQPFVVVERLGQLRGMVAELAGKLRTRSAKLQKNLLPRRLNFWKIVLHADLKSLLLRQRNLPFRQHQQR